MKLAPPSALVYPPALREHLKESVLAEVAPINWTNAMTLISVAILVGTELIGAGAAAGLSLIHI